MDGVDMPNHQRLKRIAPSASARTTCSDYLLAYFFGASELGRTPTILEKVKRNPCRDSPYAPWHFLNFFPAPHQQGSLPPILSCSSLPTVSPPSPPLPPTAWAAAVSTAAPPATATCSRADGWASSVP